MTDVKAMCAKEFAVGARIIDELHELECKVSRVRVLSTLMSMEQHPPVLVPDVVVSPPSDDDDEDGDLASD